MAFQPSKKQEAVLDYIRTGLPYIKAAKAAGISNTIFHKWKREIPEFRAMVEAAKDSGERVKAQVAEMGAPLGLVTDDHLNVFLKEYLHTGSIEVGCKKAGVDFLTVCLALDDAHESYDPKLAAEVKRVEAAILQKIEDKFIAHALTGSDRETSANMKWALEKLDRRKYGQKKEIEVTGQVGHVYNTEQQSALLLRFLENMESEESSPQQLESEVVDGHIIEDNEDQAEEPKRLRGAVSSEGGDA